MRIWGIAKHLNHCDELAKRLVTRNGKPIPFESYHAARGIRQQRHLAHTEVEQYLSPELSSVLIRAIKTGAFDKSVDPYDKLTQREKQVLQLIAHGKSNKEIAVMLDLSVNTVAVHRANLMSALGVHKTAELVLFAVKKGLVLPD